MSTHPRTRLRLKSEKLFEKSSKLINWHEPVLDFLAGTIKYVISDSGTIHEDSAILGFNALAIRKSTEKGIVRIWILSNNRDVRRKCFIINI